MTGFNAVYKAVFDAVKAALVYVVAVPAHDEVQEVPAHGVSSIKTVLLGEQFTLGDLPKAVINAEPAPIAPETKDGLLVVTVRGSIVIVIRDYEPKDWFTDVIPVMSDVVDALLADRSLGGAAQDCRPTVFSPGEIKFQDKGAVLGVGKDSFKDKILYGGVVGFEAQVWYQP